MVLKAQQIDVSHYYQLHNLHQGPAMVLASRDVSASVKMTQNTHFENKLWVLESAGNGYYFLKNEALGSEGYLHVLKDNYDHLFCSEKKEQSNYKWKFEEADLGLKFSNKYFGDKIVLDCDPERTGENIFFVENSLAWGQYWFLVKTLKLPFAISSIRVYDLSNNLILDEYVFSASSAIMTALETKGSVTLNKSLTSEISLEGPYTVVIEYIKNDTLHVKKFYSGNTLTVADF
ncbi:hypothetical protein SCB49_09670 [unidentified eubacterium SCB49]|nr:hypothetical protein SCB49_09670 [unidentified eubacterium SCB49]